MSFLELAIKFCAGGVIVVLVSWFAKSNNPTFAGLVVLFPAITLVSFMFMLIDSNLKSDAIKRATLGSIYYIPSTLAFLVVFYFAYKFLENYWSLAIALSAWVVVAVMLTIINKNFLHF